MKIGIISDTHDRLDTLESAVKIFQQHQVAIILHCGDWVSPFTLEYFDTVCQKIGLRVPVKSIYGNNEGDLRRIPIRNQSLANPIEFSDKLSLTLDLDGRKAVLFHGHDPVLLQGLIDSQTYDVVFCGHTHQARTELIGKTLVVNPGSTSFTAQSKPTGHASVAVYDTKKNTAVIYQLPVIQQE